jgi:hypothetical protein
MQELLGHLNTVMEAELPDVPEYRTELLQWAEQMERQFAALRVRLAPDELIDQLNSRIDEHDHRA